MADITVVGLGAMGARIASTLLDGGHAVHVFNRTASKAAPLIAAGARQTASAAAAIGASPVTLFALARGGDIEPMCGDVDIQGKTLVNLSSLAPGDAAPLGERLTARGADYLTGAILANPGQVGAADTAILYSGARTAFAAHEAMLRELAGRSIFVDDSFDGAKHLSLSLCALLHTGFAGFFEGVNLAHAHGMSASNYARAVVEVLGPFARRMLIDVAGRIDARDTSAAQSAIDTEAHVAALVSGLLGDKGYPSRGIDATGRYLDAARKAGIGDMGLAAMPAFLRGESPSG